MGQARQEAEHPKKQARHFQQSKTNDESNKRTMIKQQSIEDLRSNAIDILAKAYLELGQNPDEETMVQMSLSLAEDLQRDFKNLDIQDIKEAFRKGIRDTEEFHITVKTYYKWIKKYRDLLWDAQYKVTTQNQDPKQVPYYKEPQKLIK